MPRCIVAHDLTIRLHSSVVNDRVMGEIMVEVRKALPNLVARLVDEVAQTRGYRISHKDVTTYLNTTEIA